MGLLQTSRQVTGHTCTEKHTIGGTELGCVLTGHAGGMHLDGRGLWWFASEALAVSV